jgi:hypothetical protein
MAFWERSIMVRRSIVADFQQSETTRISTRRDDF